MAQNSKFSGSLAERRMKLALYASRAARRFPQTRKIAKIMCRLLVGNPSAEGDAANARAFLGGIHRDVRSSALFENKIVGRKYDLQIIMPVYNVERKLEGAIKSVLEQETRYSFLLVIVNDGSPDHSDDIIRRYEGDPRIRVIRQENKGFSGARNAGLREIEGRYVMFVDSDDALEKGAIESLMATACEDDADIVEGNYVEIKNGRAALRHVHDEAHVNGTVKLGQPWAKVFRAEMFSRIGFPEHYWYEDSIGAFLLYPTAKRVSATDKPVYRYLINPKGISATSRGKAQTLDTLYITEALLRDDEQTGLLSAELQSLYEHMFIQIRINFNRTFWLGERVRQSVFLVSCELMERYFSGCATNVASSEPLEQAVRTRNYKAYTISCLLN